MRIFALAALCVSVWMPIASAQAPLQTVPIEPSQRVMLEWKADAAERALSVGLAVVAEGLYRDLLEVPGQGEDALTQLRVQLAASLIAQRRFIAAGSVLQEIPEGDYSAAYHLYRAVCAYGTGRNVDRDILKRSLDAVSVDQLRAEELSWFYVLRGLWAELNGRSPAARKAFEQARGAAVSEMQQAFFDSLILREEILKTPVNEALEREARTKLDQFAGSSAAYPYAREYAILLHNQGRDEEAIEVITQELANPRSGYGSREREQLLLLKGLFYRKDTLSRRDALRSIVREGKSREVMAIALQLLAGADTEQQQLELTEFLDSMIKQGASHPLLGQMYYIRSQLALAQGQTELAETYAGELLEKFPGLSEITSVYRLLAYAALKRTPPQYRTAADFLIQIRDQTEALDELQTLNRLIGDCYFLNQDYRNAVDFYEAARDKGVGEAYDGALFLRLVTAEVRGGQIQDALQLIDEADFSGSISAPDRWRAEWNVAQALQAAGDSDAALQRVRLLLSDDIGGAVPIALDLRLRWLEARLSLLAGDTEDVDTRVAALLLRVKSIPAGTLDPGPAEVRLLVTEVLLLQADILIRLGDSTAGMEVLTRLRDGYPESSAAERSYLTEAGYHASINDFIAAQETLLKLASLYEESNFASQALFEAALYCEQRGPAHFKEAVRVHHNLIERYPTDPLFFAARLKQGDLLRQMNKFGDAQKIYEDLIHSFPEHPRRYVAELSRADCMLALAKNNDEQLKDVAIALERLINMPNLPVDFQSEVGYKWGFALLQRDALEEAQEVFALMFKFNDENANRLGVTGRYWMSRVLLELGTLLEEGGELAEARRVYRKMVAYNLPGRTLAQSRADRLPVVGE